MLTTATPDNGM